MAADVTITYTLHAVRRMLRRDIEESEVLDTILTGDVIEEYPEDQPFPSQLFFKVAARGPLHVVAAWDESRSVWNVVTAYRPEARRWNPDFRTRRK